jgi:hypothetical protein
MTVKIDTDAEINSIRLKNQALVPSNPASGYKSLFVKNDGLFFVNSGGDAVGPFITGTSSTGTVVQEFTTQFITIEQNITFTPQGSAPSTSGGKGKQAAVGNDLYYVNPSGTVYLLTAPRILLYTWDGILYVTSGTSKIYNQLGSIYTFQEIFCSVSNAPTLASIVVDVNKNGTTVLNTKAIIPAGSVTGSSADFSVSTWNPGDYLTVDVDQIGSGTAGSNLVTHILIKQTA